MPVLITDAQARAIAADWHGGQRSALYSLASSGCIDTDRVRDEIGRDIVRLEVGRERRPLLALEYVAAHGDRPRVAGWPRLWDSTEPTVEQC